LSSGTPNSRMRSGAFVATVRRHEALELSPTSSHGDIAEEHDRAQRAKDSEMSQQDTLSVTV
jgi:hypothetical protein